jgi:16S rRNA (cytosine967-C5)-methyltransferase
VRCGCIRSSLPDHDRITDKKLAAHVAEGGRLCALVMELWQRTRMDWGFVTDRLAVAFRRETWIGSHERRFVSETLYGLVRHLRRVDAALARGRPTARAPRDLERLLALLVLEGLIEPARAARVIGELDWNAVAGIDEVIAQERKLVPRIALAASLPDWLAQRLVDDWGDEAEGLALALNRRAPMTVRANLLVGDRDALAAELAEVKIATTPGAWCDTALHIESRTNLFGLAAFTRGAMEAQDEGSQLLADVAAACVRASAGAGRVPRVVVDLCAGAGGKTLAIAARLGNRGRIIATDVDANKLEELRRRARRAQVTSAQTIALDAERSPAALDALRGKADVVLVDAPCSGIGALRRNPEARWRLREADLTGFAARQKEILGGARALLAPGGWLMYATCTLLGVENADVVASVVGPGLAEVPLTDVLGARAPGLGDGNAFTMTPHRHGSDGFYARVMRRAD